MSDENATESSFDKGLKTTMGVVLALFLLFVVAPCAVCGGCSALMGGGDYSTDTETEEVDLGSIEGEGGNAPVDDHE